MGSFIMVLGGIGFFLLGMSLMADGLKTIAGDALKKLLSRFTGGTFSSIMTGAVITLLVQSSTATTLMTIGFVSAGMLTFLQATGVVFGANLGTTSTGWMVAFIGLKFSISQMALPFIGVGVLMKQFSKGRWAQLGLVIAGFGLLFIGIQFLQDGMSELNTYFNLGAFTGDTLIQRLVLLAIGMAMTIVMQSSSAAVATTITVLATGTIGLEQAIALVIGQNVGTTATAIIAAMGGSASAKRTAAAHTLFNLATALVVILLFPYVIQILVWSTSGLGWEDPAMMLALFHTGFSLFGILLFAPFIRQFTTLIERLLPEQKSLITQHLDTQIITLPAVAVETAHRALKEAAAQTLTAAIDKCQALSLAGGRGKTAAEEVDKRLLSIEQDMEQVRAFVGQIRMESSQSAAGYISILHAQDHLLRLNRLVLTTMTDLSLTDRAHRMYPVVSGFVTHLEQCNLALASSEETEAMAASAKAYSRELATYRKEERAQSFNEQAGVSQAMDEALRDVQVILFLDGVAYHVWRMLAHFSGTADEE